MTQQPETPEQEVEALTAELPVIDNVKKLIDSYIVAHRNGSSREDYAEAQRLAEKIQTNMRGNTKGKPSMVVILTCFLVIRGVWESFAESKRNALNDAHRRCALKNVTKH